jgi:ATP-dependent exoDNAse (exonuclease V) alpha subunit
MAIYHATTKPISRSAGRSAVAAAAYRSGSQLTDERTGQRHDYTRKGGVESAEVIMPDGSTTDRAALWNAAEAAEIRKDARTAREWEVALPSELSKEQRRELAQGFARSLSERYGVAADCAIHAPGGLGDQRNHHAHILLTTRQVAMEDGEIVMGTKSDLELDNKQRAQRGLSSSEQQIKDIRQEWADRQNSALEQAHSDERVDHRSHAERGIEVEPGRHLGPAGTALKRELAAVQQALGEAREILKGIAADIASTAKSAVRGIVDRFREANQGISSGEPSQGGILAGLREQRQEGGVAQDRDSAAQPAMQAKDQEQTL